MRGFHFSLRWLFGIVSFLAVGCGLLIYASPLLSKLTATLTVVVLLAAVPAAIYHAGDRRAFWGGFALFGFAYLWMLCGTWQSLDGSTALRERLVTTDLLTRCHEVLPSTQASVNVNSTNPTPVATAWVTYGGSVAFNPYAGQPAVPPGGASLPYQLPGTVAVVSGAVDRTSFLTTGHSLFAILFALLGGAIARRCSSRAGAEKGTQLV